MSVTVAPYPVLDKGLESTFHVSLLVLSEVQPCPFYRVKDPEATAGTRALSTPQGLPDPLHRSDCGSVTSCGHSSRGEVKSTALQPSLDSRTVADPRRLSGVLFRPGPLCLQSAAQSQVGCPASKAFSLCRHSWGQEVGSGAEEPGAQFGLRTFFLRSQTQFCMPFERK